MRILIAEDDLVSCRILESTLAGWGYEVIVTRSGAEAWETLQQENAPRLAILDWVMPGIDGVEVCRRVRQIETSTPTYLILLTAKGSKQNIVEGLSGGANDYITKPFNRDELRARVKVGVAVVELQQDLAERVAELEAALAHVKLLQGILPICSYCKHVRDDQNYWQNVETYVTNHSEAKFSHSICPDCYESVVKPQMDALQATKSTKST
ncbi:MAG TPA: response regulator transcription factor [Pyrinomonadaceae bacterium]|nr:response regulator transcription factor [Pyrinomonadaceae bacterium]